MVLLILESLGSVELLFILVMALVFFGPRKLPQISRTLGKNLAEFRRASDDFKATWNREVSLEEFNLTNSTVDHVVPFKENSILGPDTAAEAAAQHSIGPVSSDHTVPRQPMKSEALYPSAEPDLPFDGTDSEIETNPAEPSRKRDWL